MNGHRPAAPCIAIIPARGGSKRLPRKNIREFAGRPMIAHAIDTARRSGLFEHIVVSTDDDEVAAVARREGAEVPFLRPAELADDHTGTVPVIAHALRRCLALGWPIEAACCVYPCVPLLEPRTLRDGWARLVRGDVAFVFPVLAFESPIQRALRRDEHGRCSPFFPEHTQTRTQDLPPAFRDAGQFYWGRTEAWLAGRSPHAEGATLVLPAAEAVDIDTPADWANAEARYRARTVQTAPARHPSRETNHAE